MDPFEILPAEIVLRIIDFLPISSVAALSRVKESWYSFIQEAHQDAIYSAPSKTYCPLSRRNLSFLPETQSFARYFDGTTSWKDLCKRQTLLRRNWEDQEPLTRESIIQVGNDAIWRFRVDWKRRIILSTSQQGGLNVTDLDTGNLLSRLGQVRPFAHMEYDDGTIVFDREGNGLEIWTFAKDTYTRGTLTPIATLPHGCTIRGFQLSYNTLCVVSTQGQGFVYDVSSVPPKLKTHLSLEHDATGHLYQDSEVVMYCLGKKGYHIHDKESGALSGILNPTKCQRFFHILHPSDPQYSIVSTGNSFSSLPSVEVFPPKDPARDRLTPIHVRDGPYGEPGERNRVSLENDEWGAGILSGLMMVGISKGGRMFVCSDWRSALREPATLETNSYLIECAADESDDRVNFGGWLSVRDNRAMFEIRDRVYVVALERGKVTIQARSSSGQSKRTGVRPSYCFSTSSATQLAVPVSFMALYDDCIMSTYTTLGWRRRTGPADPVQLGEQTHGRFRIFPTKTIRILSLAPSLNPEDDAINNSPASTAPSHDTHANILEIMEMLSDEEDDDDDDDDLEVENGSA